MLLKIKALIAAAIGGAFFALSLWVAILKNKNKELETQGKIEKIKFIQQEAANDALKQSQNAIQSANAAVNHGAVGDAAKWLQDNANRDNPRP